MSLKACSYCNIKIEVPLDRCPNCGQAQPPRITGCLTSLPSNRRHPVEKAVNVKLIYSLLSIIFLSILLGLTFKSPRNYIGATLGVASCQFRLYELHTQEGNTNKANYWLQRAAKNGDINAEYDYGIALESRSPLPYKNTETIFWIRKAAEHEHAFAEMELGRLLASSESVHWFKKATAYQFPAAYAALGDCYYDGTVVKRDIVMAYVYYYLAINPPAPACSIIGLPSSIYDIFNNCVNPMWKTMFDLTHSEMTEWQVKEAHRLIRQYYITNDLVPSTGDM